MLCIVSLVIAQLMFPLTGYMQVVLIQRQVLVARSNSTQVFSLVLMLDLSLIDNV